jgi:hypothetical protein
MEFAMADSNYLPLVHLSQLIRDPFVRAAFERADRDRGEPMLVPAHPPRPKLEGGAAVVPELALELA